MEDKAIFEKFLLKGNSFERQKGGIHALIEIWIYGQGIAG